ncbi:MAG: DUF7151 family protein [Myxococcota bacterium]
MRTFLIFVLMFVTIFFVVSCEDPQNGDDGINSLVEVKNEPEGSNCEYGGVRIEHGMDLDRNGFLSPDEIDGQQFICNPDSVDTCDCEDGENGHATLFCIYDEDPGENCEYGGKSLNWGLDLNDDEELTVSEITGTEYICNGTPGAPTLIEINYEDPGINCEYGGNVITTGVDYNQNDILDPSEINSKNYICNGHDGHNALVETDTEPSGSNCPEGGTVINSGIDYNNNSVLDQSEITDTSYICN